MTSDRRVEFVVSGVVYRRDDHFAAYIKGLGITAYGDSIEAARDRAVTLAETTLNVIENRQGTDVAKDRLDRAGIAWREVTEGQWEAPAMIRQPAQGDPVAV